ncbi:phragmoplast orienting kinesin 2 [Nicotiana attenuata]|uniref:Phragmoplast orienting kinesin 2 n=1 Tax=Nicotiana attenuata TaxID=49451 RepID=A0A314KW19_NICAT|nr:phragmoplast orienting kinesin 2 [Nicotiana attenuata]
MLRDFKFLRRNSGKNARAEEIENVPVDPRDSMGPQTSTDSTRPPLNTIQEATRNLKGGADQQMGVRVTKIDKTPTKPKASQYSDITKTPEKPIGLPKGRYGWTQKADSSSSTVEAGDEATTCGVQSRAGAVNATPRSMRTIGRANSGYSESHSNQTTPSKSVTKPPTPSFCLAGGSRPLASGGARMANYAALYRGIPSSGNSLTVVDTVEVPHFDLKENPSFWMEHNVQVLIRMRPLNNMERSTNGYNRCLKQESAQCITWIGQPETRFTFDHVACETINQETLFKMVGLPMVENCLSGYNSSIFAYGQTGSGKTHTMLGEIEELEIRPSPNRGMTPRIFEFLFARIRAEEESRRDERLQYSCKCSFLEIYNEQITDLLDPSSTNLMLREDSTKGVYVENLSEFEVQTVGDILRLLTQGSLNRKVASTNMNRESSRSHSVFTCIIESRWEKNSTDNFRFARLNLVDLAGSERQKTSGAEGERLKEAASINRSLSVLGHVIMVLVDVANGRPRHVPYRDSRLTFLLQDSLGGNSKTMIIANVSPSICCAAETLNTLKFAQRAKLIQNNAVVNEDSSADVTALKHQIRLLKEELSSLKRQNVSRALSFGQTTISGDCRMEDDSSYAEKELETDQHGSLITKEAKGIVRLSSKQLKSLETTLAGALRREQMAETSIKQLEAEIEQLNRLVRQREEDNRCNKMMVKFREEKIQRMESLVNGLIPADNYLLEENSALTEEIQFLQAKVDRNPEVTRFACENIRLLEQLRRFQDFYEEGEREILLAEISNLRDQLLTNIDGSLKQHSHLDMNIPSQDSTHVCDEETALHSELKKTLYELEECRTNLNCCLEKNEKLSREIDELRGSLNSISSADNDHNGGNEVRKESIPEALALDGKSTTADQKEKEDTRKEDMMKKVEEIMDLQLELDILKVIVQEERLHRNELEQSAQSMMQDLESSKEQLLLVTKKCEDVQAELREAKSIIEALESQHLLAITEVEDLRNSNSHYAELLQKQELEISSLKEQMIRQELRDLSSSKLLESDDSPLQAKLKKMHDSLEKAKMLNRRYQNDCEFQVSNEEAMDEISRQAEAETAEVIVCLQEELLLLQQEVRNSSLKEMESTKRLTELETEVKSLEAKLSLMTEENRKLGEIVHGKEKELIDMSEEWAQVNSEIEAIVSGGHEALKDACEQLDFISSTFPDKRSRISEQFGRLTKCIFEKDLFIEELNQSLENALNKRNDMESMLRSLRGAALVMTEAHQLDCREKDAEILSLTSQLSSKAHVISELENKIKHGEDQLRKASVSATVAFVVVNWLSEQNSNYIDALSQKDTQLKESLETSRQKDAILCDQASVVAAAENQNESLEEQRQKLEESDLLKTIEKLTELQAGVSTVRSHLSECVERSGSPGKDISNEADASFSSDYKFETRTVELVDDKLQKIEDAVQESCSSWYEQKKLLEAELCDAKAVAAQKTTEAFCILAKFEEVQDTMKDADIMINELMIANESLKLDIKELKRKEISLADQRDILVNENQSLQSANDLKNMHSQRLEHEFESDLAMMQRLVLEMEDIVSQTATTSTDELKSVTTDLLIIKSQLHESTKCMRSWLEEIWSDIIVKDCALSVLHLCHMGILLEAAAGLNAENGLLHHGLSESNSLISKLKEQNIKAQKELEMCRTLKGKLLADIKSNFDRVVRKESDAGEFTSKLGSFEKKILDLQFQEESMLARSEQMGSELVELMKEIDLSNKAVLTSVIDQERVLKDKEEALKSLEDSLTMEFLAKGFESLILSSELEESTILISELERKTKHFCEVAESLKREIIFGNLDVALTASILLDKEVEVSILQQEVAEAGMKHQNMLAELTEMNSMIAKVHSRNNALEQDTCSLMEVSCLNETLKRELGELVEAKTVLTTQVQELSSENEKLLEELQTKDSALESSSSRIFFLDQQNQMLQNESCLLEAASCRLQNDMEMKDAEISKMNCLEKEIEALQHEITELKGERCLLFQELEVKKADMESCDLKPQIERINALDAENASMRNQLRSHEKCTYDTFDMVLKVNSIGSKAFYAFQNRSAELDTMLQDIHEEVERGSKFLQEFESLKNFAEEILLQSASLQNELVRKDDIIKGMLFDLSLLQESASNHKDQKDEIDDLVASISTLETVLDEAVCKGQALEVQLQEKISKIALLESDILQKCKDIELLSSENSELAASAKDTIEAKCSMEEELLEKREVCENLEIELTKFGDIVSEMNNSIECLKKNLNDVTGERDDLHGEIVRLKRELDVAQTLAEESEAIAIEAKEVAEMAKLQAEEKEEEVTLLERSVEELECTVNVLENEVEFVRGEAERQRLQREELELELHAIKQQMNNVKGSDVDMKRHLEEKEKNLQEASQRIQLLEGEIISRDAEIAHFKTHISELNLHAEAQACEYKEKFKALEAMVEKVKMDPHATQAPTLSSSKLEKNASKPRGSGSPFKCIGIGLVQQLMSERDEDHSAERHRIQELEALAASRQKEIFMLNSKLAAAESMTHDVIRDLLGLKLDMNNYATLLDNQQVQMLTEKARLRNADAQFKEQEVLKLKQQLNEFIEERKGWIEEIERKQAEMVAAQIALEKLHQRDHLLTTENEMIKMENVNHKKRVMELEADIKKLSGQQNLQQRIHHHAKIKEENNLLKNQNDDLIVKLRKAETILSRVREELAYFRQTNGRSPYINFDKEQILENKLKEKEDERLQLAQKLLGLCATVLKAAGITTTSEIGISAAEEALEQLKNKMNSLERELQDAKFKNKMTNERIRLSEIMPQSSPLRIDENGQTSNRGSSPLTVFDR